MIHDKSKSLSDVGADYYLINLIDVFADNQFKEIGGSSH